MVQNNIINGNRSFTCAFHVLFFFFVLGGNRTYIINENESHTCGRHYFNCRLWIEGVLNVIPEHIKITSDLLYSSTMSTLFLYLHASWNILRLNQVGMPCLLTNLPTYYDLPSVFKFIFAITLLFFQIVDYRILQTDKEKWIPSLIFAHH